MNNIFEILYHLNKKTLDIQSNDIKQWLRIEDPTENYKDSLKR